MNLEPLKRRLRPLVRWPAFLWAVVSGAVTGRIGYRAWYLSRHVHADTNGWSTDVLVAATNLRRSKVHVTSEVAEQVRRDGWAMLPFRMDDDAVEELRTAMTVRPGVPKGEAGKLPPQPIDLERPAAPAYHFEAPALADVPAFRAFGRDPRIIHLARAYLGVEPSLAICKAWWSVPWAEGPSSANAQLWHYDLAHPAWIKVFVYLTDVTEASGPHVVVPGTHRRDAAGRRVRSAIVRRSDEEIAAAYPDIEPVAITGTAGTMFAVDTRCWHKGEAPVSDPRLVAQVYWTNCRVGPPSDAEQVLFGA